jgi:hypothetical protein
LIRLAKPWKLNTREMHGKKLRAHCIACLAPGRPIKSILAWAIGSSLLLGMGLASETAHEDGSAPPPAALRQASGVIPLLGGISLIVGLG